ncbi:MAG: ABC transporter ATP-binding protein [Acidimicrobiaceae bacterium]|nr:ABC transporter ATP-binding protein [Acidimicrobiaceae bacterium]
MAESILEIEKMSAGYDQADVVREVSINVNAGEVVALFGPNGAGKTTTLRVISGIIKPSGGQVRYHGQDLTKLSPTKRARAGIAHVPEGRGIFFGLTVAEHIRLGYRGEVIEPEVVYEYFPALRELRDRAAGLLSGGEQQMLAVARNLARRPKLLLIDELSLGLAPVLVERLLPVVRQYALDSQCGVLLVEQHVALAVEIADRCYVLSHGDIVLHDSGAALKADPDLVVASYMGQRALPDEAEATA